MSKGLEALESINEIQLNYSEAKHGILNPRDICPDEFAIIEKELKRLEEYDKIELNGLIERHKELLKEKKANKKKLKALEIIKEKRVNVYVVFNTSSVEEYNDCWYGACLELTQAEFDLLKEVLL